MPQDGQQEPLDTLIRNLRHGPLTADLAAQLAEHVQQLRVEQLAGHVLRVEQLAERDHERIVQLADGARGRDGVFAALRQTLETTQARVAAVEARSMDTAQRHTAGMMRVDALEAGRTGRAPIEFIKPHHRPARTEYPAQAPDFVHPDHLTTVHEVAADQGDYMAKAIMTLTNERDTAKRQLANLQRERQALIDQRDTAEGDRSRAVDRAHVHSKNIATLNGTIEHLRVERDTLQAQYESAREGGRRAHEDSAQVRNALHTATKERDNAMRAADKAKAQRDGARSTIVDQARQIGDLRLTLEHENKAHAAALHHKDAQREIDFAEGSKQNARLIEENQRLRSLSGSMWPPSERDKTLLEVVDLQNRYDATHAAHQSALDRLRDIREQLQIHRERHAVSIRHLENAQRTLTERDDETARMRPLVTTAQLAAAAWDAEPASSIANLSAPFIDSLYKLATASDVYEKACSDAAEDQPF